MTTIEIASGFRRWAAKIDDRPATRDFLEDLPLKLNLRDYGGKEKIAVSPRAFTREGAPVAMTPQAGEIAF